MEATCMTGETGVKVCVCIFVLFNHRSSGLLVFDSIRANFFSAAFNYLFNLQFYNEGTGLKLDLEKFSAILFQTLIRSLLKFHFWMVDAF